MAGVVVVGSMWGDEGKGKVTDYLAQKAAHPSGTGTNIHHAVDFGGCKLCNLTNHIGGDLQAAVYNIGI